MIEVKKWYCPKCKQKHEKQGDEPIKTDCKNCGRVVRWKLSEGGEGSDDGITRIENKTK